MEQRQPQILLSIGCKTTTWTLMVVFILIHHGLMVIQVGQTRQQVIHTLVLVNDEDGMTWL